MQDIYNTVLSERVMQLYSMKNCCLEKMVRENNGLYLNSVTHYHDLRKANLVTIILSLRSFNYDTLNEQSLLTHVYDNASKETLASVLDVYYSIELHTHEYRYFRRDLMLKLVQLLEYVYDHKN